MKTRNGFVSNSSSSSFVVSKHFISGHQLEQIRNHIEVAKEMGWIHNSSREHDLGWPEAWDISENEHEVEGNTTMTNFDMERFLEFIGVDMSKVHIWSDG